MFSICFLLLDSVLTMVSIPTVLLTCVLPLTHSSNVYEDTLGTVVFTHVIYRHGDRSPTESYPYDPYKDIVWPSGIGQLTKVVGGTADCPRYVAEIELLRNSPFVKGLMIKYKQLFDYVSFNTGSPINCFMDLFKIYDILFVQYLYNLTLPQWAESVFPEPMGEAAMYHFILPTSTQPLQRLRTGPILKEIVQHFLQKVEGTLDPNRTMWMYSAHDTTIANILNTLNIYDYHFPPYAATILIDLRRRGDEHFVTIQYRNTTKSEPYLLLIPGCTVDCPLEMFVQIVTPLIPSDWELECQE